MGSDLDEIGNGFGEGLALAEGDFFSNVSPPGGGGTDGGSGGRNVGLETLGFT